MRTLTLIAVECGNGMSYFEPSMEMPERIGKAAGDIFAALLVVSILTLVLNITLGFMLQ